MSYYVVPMNPELPPTTLKELGDAMDVAEQRLNDARLEFSRAQDEYRDRIKAYLKIKQDTGEQ